MSAAADVDAAVQAPRRAQSAWRATPVQARAGAVLALREALLAAAPHLMKGESLEGVATGVDVEAVALRG